MADEPSWSDEPVTGITPGGTSLITGESFAGAIPLTAPPAGAYAEQLRRVEIIARAAGIKPNKGATFTQRRLEWLVRQLAPLIPALRYTTATGIAASLAPTFDGKRGGRPQAWTERKLLWLMREFEARVSGAAHDEWDKEILSRINTYNEMGYDEPKVLQNKLAEARQLFDGFLQSNADEAECLVAEQGLMPDGTTTAQARRAVVAFFLLDWRIARIDNPSRADMTFLEYLQGGIDPENGPHA